MKKLILVLGLVILQFALSADFEPPKVHSTIMLDAKFFSGGDSNNGNNYDTSNRYQVRKAALEFEGDWQQLEYGIEFGVSTCTGSSVQLKLMEAELMYRWNKKLKLGIKQGHVLRGFVGSVECRDRLTMEKPNFFKTFATCHPMGFVAEYYLELGDITALETELALMNGTNSTLDGEHDYNLAAKFYTPLDGLALCAGYNFTAQNYYDDNYNLYSDEGYRTFFGTNYENYNISATAECFIGKGFSDAETEMLAYYLQAGYAIPLNIPQIKYIQPVFMYEFWDKDSEENTKSEYTYLNTGLNISLNEYTKLKLNYQIPQDEPENSVEQESSFVIRLQIGN